MRMYVFTRVQHATHSSAAAKHSVAPQNVLNAQRLLLHRGCRSSAAFDTRRVMVAFSISTATAASEKSRKLVNLEAWRLSLHGETFVRTTARC